jgi:MarR family
MVEMKQIEPCVSLDFGDNTGVTITVSARLQQGAQNWTPEEAGVWFARNWQKAADVLTAMTVHEALAVGARLVRQGEVAWALSGGEAPPALTETLLDIPAVESAAPITIPVQSQSLPFSEDSPRRYEDPEDNGGEVESTGQESSGVAPPRIPESAADSPDQKKVVRHLNRAGRAMSVADLKRETGLSQYRVTKAVELLTDKGLIRAETAPGKGRWKEQTVYSGSGSR